MPLGLTRSWCIFFPVFLYTFACLSICGIHILRIILQDLAPEAEEGQRCYGIFIPVMHIWKLTLQHLVVMQPLLP